MAAITVDADLWAEATNHLFERPEQVGFFLARYDPSARRFTLTHWRALAQAELAYRSDHHVEITDDAKTAAIKWATREDAVLVEAHSHGRRGDPEFSYSDLSGFRDWVPHVRWRLRGGPYAAIVVAGEELDALAWIDETPEQVETIEVTRTLRASGDTLQSIGRREPWRRSHG
jgi:hypothetical protein